MWRDRRVLDLLGIDVPIVQAPMAGAQLGSMAAAVSAAGGLGSLPCAMLTPEHIKREVDIIRQQTARPFNLNFFCHTQPSSDPERERKWQARLAPYYQELGADMNAPPGAARLPFNEALCEMMVDLRPPVISFHFGLPAMEFVQRLKAVDCVILSSATTIAEALWLEAHGVDAIIAQGYEAGGHRGMFLSDDVATQVGTMALVPQMVDAVKVPVIAAGAITDARAIAAALMLGAAAVQIGTAYLFCPEATISTMHRDALKKARDDGSVLTNVMTGRPARGLLNRLIREIGPISPEAPTFPLAAGAIQPLRQAAEAQGSGDFSPLWSGQSARLGREMDAGRLTTTLASETLTLLNRSGV